VFTSLRKAAAAASLLVVGGCALQRTPADAGHPYVIMVSFDAFRADYIDRYHPRAFEEVASRGIRAEALIPSFPSKTFPNHYTLATGLYPGSHGITGNSFYDPARHASFRSSAAATVRDGTWYGGEPIWVTAEKNGLKSASYFWAGSEASIEGIRPTYWKVYDEKIANLDRVNGVIEWLRAPAAARPHLVLLYFSEVDDTTHKFGPNSEHTAVAVADVDRALRALLDSVKNLPVHDSVNIVLVSDHGMAATDTLHVIPVGNLMTSSGVDTAGVVMSDNGPTLSLWFNGDSARMTAAHRALRNSLTHAKIYDRKAAPERWHLRDNPRFGDLLIVADEGWILKRSSADKAPSLGNHGYDPYSTMSMRGIFLAAGPGVRPNGILPAFENVNVYSFVAALLRLERIPVTDGSIAPLAGSLR
jgi:predicted AlkP superfamily pyrophosphatase or phosphodiesterase